MEELAMSVLLSNLVARPPTVEDFPAIAELAEACDIAEHGTAEISMRDLASGFQHDSFHLESDARVIVSDRRQFVGFASVWHRDYEAFSAFICVHPQERGRGIGTLLLRLAEQHARELMHDAYSGACIGLRVEVSANNDQAGSLFEREGYHSIGAFWRVTLELADASGEGLIPPRKLADDMEVASGQLTGAAQLFDRDGIYSVRRFVTYEKELRPATKECDCPDERDETLIGV